MSTSLYETIFNTLRDEINQGTYKTGEMLPSENMLARSFNTTRMTVRNALTRLSDEGYIYPVAGKGYYIKEKKFDQYLFEFNEARILNKDIEQSRLLSADIIKPDVDLSYNLRLPGNSRIVAIKRVLYADGKIVAYDEKFIPYYSGMPIIESDLNQATLAEILANKEPVFTLKKKLQISVIDCCQELMNILHLNLPQPLFRIEQTLLDNESEPIGWARMTYLMDYFTINASLIVNK